VGFDSGHWDGLSDFGHDPVGHLGRALLVVTGCWTRKTVISPDFAPRMTHITLGCGGHRLSDVNHEQPAWLAATAAKFGYGRVTVDDGYSLTFEFVRTDVSAL
jgi:Iron/zinc purple acid phosphatase-like protein C